MQPGFRIALDAQSAAEEQRIRILTPGGEQPEILQRTADADIRVARGGRLQAPVLDAEMNPARGITNMNAHGLAVYFREPSGERLATQQMVERAHEQLRVHRVGDQFQRQEQGMGQHVHPKS